MASTQQVKNSHFKSHWVGISWEVDHAGEQNKYYAFRKECSLAGNIKSAFVRITADSRFILFINGRFVGRGPARCFPKKQAFETYDIKDYLVEDRNCVAVLVHRFGTSIGQYINRGRTGLLIYGEVEMEGGDKEVIKTDLSWKVKEAYWFRPTTTRLTCQLGFQEIFDCRIEPLQWKKAGFPDEKYGWYHVWFIGPAGIHPWLQLEPSGLKPLEEKEIMGKYFFAAKCPARKAVRNIANIVDYWIDDTFEKVNLRSPNEEGWISMNVPENEDLAVSLGYDFVFAGYPMLEVQGAPAGGIVDVFYHTSLDEDGVPIPDRGFGSDWEGLADRFICCQGTSQWRPYFLKGFRFFTCIFRGFKKFKFRLRVIETHYPVEERGKFHASDPIFDAIWNVSIRTLKSTMLDAHVDNPWREQGQWLFDGIIAGFGALSSFGCDDLMRRGLIQWGNTLLPEGFLNSLVPTENNFMSIIDFSFEWVRGLWKYYLYTGDLFLLKECSKSLKMILDSSARLTTEEKLFIPPEGYQYFVDWTDMERLHYGFTLNAMLLQAYEDAMRISTELGNAEEVRKNRERRKSLRKALEERFWSESSRCWREHLTPNARVTKLLEERIQPSAWPQAILRKCTGIGSLHGNATALSLRLGNRNQQAGALKYVKRAFVPGQNEVNFFSPIWTERIFSALFESRARKEAILYIKNLLGKEIELGATTWPEGFSRGKEFVRSISNWSSAQEAASCINYILHHYIIGVYPSLPGFKRFVFRPYLGNLEFATASVPLPLGSFEIRCEKKHGLVSGFINVPRGIYGMALKTTEGDKEIKPGKSSFLWKEDF